MLIGREKEKKIETLLKNKLIIHCGAYENIHFLHLYIYAHRVLSKVNDIKCIFGDKIMYRIDLYK